MTAPNDLQNENQNDEQNPTSGDPSAPPTNSTAGEADIYRRFAEDSQRREQEALRQMNEMRDQIATMQRNNNQPADLDEEAIGNMMSSENPVERVRAFRAMVQHDVQRTIAPIQQEVGQFARDRKIGEVVDSVLRSYPAAFIPYRDNFIAAVKQNIGAADPSINIVDLVIKAAIGDAQLNAIRNVPPTPPAPTSDNPPPAKPLPPRTPNGRPAPTADRSVNLTESEKASKKRLDPNNKMSDAEFKERIYAKDSVMTYDITKVGV